jgi:DNA ligase-1
MNFSEFSKYLARLEDTPSRLEITRILSELFARSTPDEIDKICYLALGVLAPNYRGVVFNIAEKLMIKALALAYGVDESEVLKLYKKEGDLGNTAELLAQKSNLKNQNWTVAEVYEKLYKIAQDEGEESVERKVEKTAEILKGIEPLSARYLARIPLGKLRLGFSDKTIIDALSWMESGSKEGSKKIGEIYNILPDVGLLAKSIKEKGVSLAAKEAKPIVGVPILPMLAQRLKSPAEMIEKMGEVFVEPKFDGLRVLIHFARAKGKNKDMVRAFTRNSNDVTEMFPEILKIGEYIDAGEAIFDSEAVGMDPEMKRILDFQTTMKRRRVHDIGETSRKIPLSFQIFDVLYKDGSSLMNTPYDERREILEKMFKANKLFVVDEKVKTKDPEIINSEYRKRIKEGLEGILVKKCTAAYVSGRTGWRWVKMKQEEEARGKLPDTVDAVVMGYTVGKGKRAGFGIGQFLVGVTDPVSEKIKTLTKIGTGLTDEQFRELALRLQKLKVSGKPERYELHKNYTPDYWVEPKLVVELAGDDLTKSPIHTSGYALRFPRLVRFRDDKDAKDATNINEIGALYKLQIKK